MRFDGHRSAVTKLAFDGEGERLVSGSRDTDVIVWDVVAEKAEARLRGHKGEITGLAFLRAGFVLTTSKDALIKVWDLEGRYCVETHVAQDSGDCWALGVSPDGDGCITGGSDGELRVWSIDLEALGSEALVNGNVKENGEKRASILTSRGILRRQGSKDRTIGISFHLKQDYIAVHGSDKAVEIWRIRSEEELHRHMQRKRRRRREKAAAAGESEIQDVQEPPEVTDVFMPHLIVRTGGKVRSAAWMDSTKTSNTKNKSLQLLIASANNLLETYSISPAHTTKSKDDSTPDYNRALSLDLPGHRTDVRTLSLSSDDRMLASASAGQLKIWNMRTRSCIRTMECGQALCSAFLPGDRIVLVGTKEGMLEMYDISTSSLIESIHAHGDSTSQQQAAVWTMAVHPDGKSVATGGADKIVKFWRFDIVDEEIPGTRRTTQRLKLTPTRQLKLSDDILSLCFCPDAKYLAISTLSNIVQIFFVDSLKLFLQLYGHKLPVLSMSISSDSKVIATSSADKNIRIWGLDFGDCHKAFFAHEDSVMCVSFIPHPVEGDEKYILFSASKDGVVKTWDTQKFEQIQRLEGHRGEIWAMAVSRTGEMCVTASHDRSLRVWEVGDDLVFLEEERERELEVMYEGALARNLERDARDEDAMLDADEDGDAVAAAGGKQTVNTLTHGEKILEALEVGMTDLEVMQAYSKEKERNSNLAPPQRNPLFLALGNISSEQHILNTLRTIPTSSLNDALLVIPFSSLPALFTFLSIFMEKRMLPEIAWRITYFLLQVHMKQIVASTALKPLLEKILEEYEGWVEEERGVMGFNLAGLEIVSREVRESEKGGYLDEPEVDEAVEKGVRKRAFASLG